MYSVKYEDAGDMPLQTADWTCSACSLAWMNRALRIDIGADEWAAVDEIGKPHNINSVYGLMDASGARLAQCLIEQGAPSWTAWLDWPTALQYADTHGLLLGGANWYHWVVARDVRGSGIWIANSAPGWRGITDQLEEADFYALGPFAGVVTPVNYSLPDASSLSMPSNK